MAFPAPPVTKSDDPDMAKKAGGGKKRTSTTPPPNSTANRIGSVLARGSNLFTRGIGGKS